MTVVTCFKTFNSLNQLKIYIDLSSNAKLWYRFVPDNNSKFIEREKEGKKGGVCATYSLDSSTKLIIEL